MHDLHVSDSQIVPMVGTDRPSPPILETEVVEALGGLLKQHGSAW